MYAVRDLQSLSSNVAYAACTVFSQPASISHHQPGSPCNTSLHLSFLCEQREGPSIPSHQTGQCYPLHLPPACLCVPLPALIHPLSLVAPQVCMCAGEASSGLSHHMRPVLPAVTSPSLLLCPNAHVNVPSNPRCILGLCLCRERDPHVRPSHQTWLVLPAVSSPSFLSFHV